MIVFLNGQFLPEEEARVSVFDRSFLYGDGLFETLLVRQTIPFLWDSHLDRMERGAEFLGIAVPYDRGHLRDRAVELMARNSRPDAVLRITLSRGAGPRGYSTRGADQPLLAMALFPAPRVDLDLPIQWRLQTAPFRIAARDVLAQFKTANKLHHILARVHAEKNGAEEALLLNHEDEVAEGAASNVFWIEQNRVCTPPVESGGLPGTTREFVWKLCLELGLSFCEQKGTVPSLRAADGVFLTLSTLGIVEVTALDGEKLRRSPLTPGLHRALQKAVQRETQSDCSTGPRGSSPA